MAEPIIALIVAFLKYGFAVAMEDFNSVAVHRTLGFFS